MPAMVDWFIESGLYPFDSLGELPRHELVVRADGDQIQRMNAAHLSHAVDAADALFQAERCPGNFQIDDETAAKMEVQSFAGCIGCE
jgi:hypothetical protein